MTGAAGSGRTKTRLACRLLWRLRWREDVLDLRWERGGRVRVGGRGGLCLPDGAAAQGFALFRFRRGRPVLRLAPGMLGAARIGGERRDLEGDAEVPLLPGDFGLVTDRAWNGAAVEFLCEEDARLPRFGRRGGFDRRIALGLGASAAAHGALLALVVAISPPRRADIATSPPPRLTRKAIIEMPKPPEEKKDEKMPDEPREIAKNLPERPTTRREKALGVLAALKRLDDRPAPLRNLDALFTTSSDPDPGPVGDSLGTLASAFPEDASAPGVGGGGTASGGGGLGTRGGAMLRASGGPSMGARKAKSVGGTVAKAPMRQMKLGGGLDRAEVLKVINEHMGAIRNCYERSLLARPDLEGKVTFEWVVGPTGGVGSVRVVSSTLKDQGVANCVMGDLKRWKFPSPTGGRDVTVVFPFIFNSSGY